MDFWFLAYVFPIDNNATSCITDGIREDLRREYVPQEQKKFDRKIKGKLKIVESCSCFHEFWVELNATEFWIEFPLAFDHSTATLKIYTKMV